MKHAILITAATCTAALTLSLGRAATPQDSKEAPVANTSGGALIEEQSCFDVLHYDLDLDVFPEKKMIAGALAMTARMVEPSREIALHLDDLLTVESVRAQALRGDGESELHPVDFIRSPGIVFMRVEDLALDDDARFRVEVVYHGVPRVAPQPPWKGGFTWKKAEGLPWFATSCQGEGADLWWPCKDHPSDKPDSFDLAFTVPKGLVVATNGRHIETVDAGDGRTTSRWHVSTPIPNYSIALNVGPYIELKRTVKSAGGEDLPVHFWVLPKSEEKGRAFLDEIVEHVAFMEDVCGPYPFRADKYGVVETPHLGMEHQTIIAYGNKFQGDRDFDYDWLHHHELSHEWWGNLVTAEDWCDFWIHEGIGTYMQPLYLERKFGREAYDKKMKIDVMKIANRGAIAPAPPRTTASIYFAAGGEDAPAGDIYFKGSWVCHSLRWLVGDEDFFKVLRRWAYPDPKSEATTDGSAVRLATTDELIGIAERVCEKDLGWFFDVYVRNAHLPALDVAHEGGTLTLRWDAPGDAAFPMPVEVLIDGKLRRVEMPGGKATIEIGDAKFEVDPDMRALRKPL